MSKQRSALRNRLEYGLYRLARGVAGVSGPVVCAALGSGLGLVFFAIGRRRREIIDFNLELVFPDKGEHERRELGREVARHFGRVSFDALRIQGLTPEQLEAEVDLEQQENLEAAVERAQGKGIFFMTAHMGSWEVAALRLGMMLDEDLAVVNRPLDNPLLDAELRRLRSLFGNSVLGRDRIARGVIRQISSGAHVGILLDQRAKASEGIEVPFLGHPTPSHPIFARLVLKTRAPVLPLYALWKTPGRYVMRFDEPLFVDELPAVEQEIAPLTAKLMDLTGEAILRAPEQWLWYHDRWRALRKA
jgi:KDO2-lipid IV(A) lauroyltransferase